MTAKIQGLKITVDKLIVGCGFQQKVGETIEFSKITVDGLCPKAYHSVYPYFLSALYNGENEVIHCKCDCGEGSLIWRTSTKKYWLKPIINICEKILLKLGIAKDAVDRKVMFDVADTERPCPIGYTVGKHYEIDIYAAVLFKKPLFCPAVFDTIYAYCELMMNGGMVPWGSDSNVAYIQCPSEKHGVVYKIEKIWPKSNGVL